MATTYITREGDSVDFIAWKFYGSTANQVVEAVLAANRGLADNGPVLPAGLSVTLPEIAAPSKTKGVKLWD
jgi:phage tail protein X